MIGFIHKHHLAKDHQWWPVVVAGGLAMVLFFVLLGFVHITFGQVLENMVKVFIDKESFLLLLTTATPFIFCGLAAVLAFRAGIYHVGMEAQFVIGMIMAIGVIEKTMASPTTWLLPMVIMAAAAGGAAIALLIGLLRRQTGLHELLSSALMVIAARWLFVPITNNMDPNQSLDNTLAAINNFLPNILFGIFHYGIFYALAAAVVMALLARYHLFFFQLKLMGYGRHVMVEIGKQEKTIYWFIMLLGGAMVGVGGAIALLENWDGLQSGGADLLPSLWLLTMGTLVALYLGRMTPLGVVAVSLILGMVAVTIKNVGIGMFAQGFFEVFCASSFLLLLLMDFLHRYKIDASDILQRARQENTSPDASNTIAKKRKTK